MNDVLSNSHIFLRSHQVQSDLLISFRIWKTFPPGTTSQTSKHSIYDIVLCTHMTLNSKSVSGAKSQLFLFFLCVLSSVAWGRLYDTFTPHTNTHIQIHTLTQNNVRVVHNTQTAGPVFLMRIMCVRVVEHVCTPIYHPSPPPHNVGCRDSGQQPPPYMWSIGQRKVIQLDILLPNGYDVTSNVSSGQSCGRRQRRRRRRRFLASAIRSDRCRRRLFVVVVNNARVRLTSLVVAVGRRCCVICSVAFWHVQRRDAA